MLPPAQNSPFRRDSNGHVDNQLAAHIGYCIPWGYHSGTFCNQSDGSARTCEPDRLIPTGADAAHRGFVASKASTWGTACRCGLGFRRECGRP